MPGNVEGMDEDLEFNESFRFFSGVDLALWLNMVVAVVLFAVVVTAIVLIA
jgi:hypothetical protein